MGHLLGQVYDKACRVKHHSVMHVIRNGFFLRSASCCFSSSTPILTLHLINTNPLINLKIDGLYVIKDGFIRFDFVTVDPECFRLVDYYSQ
jgi:hypothetical protein